MSAPTDALDPERIRRVTSTAALPGGHTVRYGTTTEDRVNPGHPRSPFRGTWEPSENRPSGAPDRIVCKEFDVESGNDVETKRIRERDAYDLIRPIQEDGGGRWLLRCYGWDDSDDTVWKAVFEEAGPPTLEYARRLNSADLQSFVEVVLLCLFDSIMELDEHNVHPRDIHPGNVLLPLGYTDHNNRNTTMPRVPDHVIIGDFDHAYYAADPLTDGTTVGLAIVSSMEVLSGSHQGGIDDLFSIAATCHILLTKGTSVWRKGQKRARFTRYAPSREWLINNGYVVSPDASTLSGLNEDLQRVLADLLHNDRATRQLAVREKAFHHALANIRTKHRSRLQQRTDLGRLTSERVRLSADGIDDYSDWIIPLDSSPRRTRGPRHTIWGYDRWAPLKDYGRAIHRAFPKIAVIPAVLIPALTVAVLTFWPDAGLLARSASEIAWPAGPWPAIQICLGVAVTALCGALFFLGSSKESRAANSSWQLALSIGAVGIIPVAAILAGPQHLMAWVEQFFYAQTVWPWENSQWQVWQWGFMLDAGIVTLFALAFIPLLVLRQRRRMKLLAMLLGGCLVLGGAGGVVVHVLSKAKTTPLGETVSCASPLDLGQTSRRFCIPATGTWAVVTSSAASDNFWKSLRLQPPFTSSLKDPTGTLSIALRDSAYPCLTVYVTVATHTSTSPVLQDPVQTVLLGGKDEVIKTLSLTRKSNKERDRRVMAGNNLFWHYVEDRVPRGLNGSSTEVYVPYSVNEGDPGRRLYGSTAVNIHTVQRNCRESDQEEISRRKMQLLGSMVIGDDHALDNTFFRSNPDALKAAGVRLEDFSIPVDDSIRPAYDYKSPDLKIRSSLANAGLYLGGTGVILSLVPPQTDLNWGSNDPLYSGWVSRDSKLGDKQTAAKLYSKIFTVGNGQIRVTVDVPTDEDPGDIGRNALEKLLSGIHLTKATTASAPPSQPQSRKQ